MQSISDRFELIELPRAAAGHSFAEDVREGLTAAGKSLPSKYFYDDVGSTLFDAITHLPEYYLTRAETEILREWGWQIVRVLDEPLDFLELGSGTAIKTRLLIEEALRIQSSMTYSPIDISVDTLRGSSLSLVESYPNLRVRAYAGDYFSVLASSALRRERRTLAMLMGSNIGNYASNDAIGLVTLLGLALKPGDGLLLGTDRKKDARALELAYDDPAGVTAAFDRNILARINRELDGGFDVRSFTHRALYDASRGVVESHLVSTKAQSVRIGALNLEVPFEKGETIHTESAHKFDESDVEMLAAASGFKVSQRWHDGGHRFDLHLLVRK